MNFIFILLLKVTAILSISSILLFTLRRSSASLRHWMISLTLMGLLLLPFFTTSLPAWEVETTAIEVLQDIPLLEPITPTNKNRIPVSEATLDQTTLAASASPTQAKPLSPSNLPWPQILLGIWFTGSLVMLFRLIAGVYRIHWISKKAHLFSRASIDPSNAYRLLVTNAIETPMTWGFFRPIILLPQNAKYWSPETLQTVIRHEAAHIQRGDYLVHILSWVSVAAYWFHPIIWWLKNRQQIEREKACDERVLNSGLSQQKYAAQLVKITRNLSGRTKSNPALPMAQFTEIKQRLFAILDFQRDRFHFTPLKQFQWASFYAGSILCLAILTPVKPVALMEVIAPDHPIIEFLQEEIPQDQSEKTIVLNTLSSPIKTTVSKATPSRPSTEELKLLPIAVTPKLQSNITSESILPERPDVIGAVFNPEQITTAETAKKAYYGKWTKGKSSFEVWTVGDIIHSPELPYLEAATPNDMIIIEEKRKTIFGTKNYRMIITKAEFNGGLIVSFQDGKPNAWNGSYKVGDPLFLYYEEEEFRFLGKQKTKWIIENLAQLSGNIYMAANDKKRWQPIDANDSKIQQYRKIKAYQYRPYEELPMNDFEHLPYWKNMRHLEHPPFDFSSVPVKEKKEMDQPIFSNNKKFGGHRKTRTRSGGNAINENQKFGTLIPNLPDNIYLQDFNFHLRQNDFDKIIFSLYLYEVNDQGIQQSLLAEPITFEATFEGWVKLGLQEYNLRASGDVLAVLELSKLEGEVGLDYIFFSTAQRSYNSFHDRTNQEWGIWEENFAWYLNIQE